MSRVCVPYYIKSPVLGTTRVVEHYSPWCQSIRKIHSRGDDDRSNRVCMADYTRLSNSADIVYAKPTLSHLASRVRKKFT